MKSIVDINRLLSSYPYIVRYEIYYLSDPNFQDNWIAELDLSRSNNMLGETIKIKLIGISDLQLKSPNINMGGVFQIEDIKGWNWERMHFCFEDSEESTIKCYSHSVQIKMNNELIEFV